MSPRRTASRPPTSRRNTSRLTTPRAATSLDDIARAIDRLAEVGQLLRGRLDAIDPIEHPARWAGVNDEARALDDRICALRDEQQRVALLGSELRPLDVSELEALRAATEAVAELVRAAAVITEVAQAAVALADVTGAAIQKLGRRA